MLGALVERHVGVGARDVLHRRVFRLLQGERPRAVGNNLAAQRHADPLRIGRDGDRMIGTRQFHGQSPAARLALNVAPLCTANKAVPRSLA
jgi:hypothetical protein